MTIPQTVVVCKLPGLLTALGHIASTRYHLASPTAEWDKVGQNGEPTIVLIDLEDEKPETFVALRKPNVRILGFLPSAPSNSALESASKCFALLQKGTDPAYVGKLIDSAAASIESEIVQGLADTQFEREGKELARIGLALSAVRDVDRLLDLILTKARQITDADAGSLYIVETSGSGNGLSGRLEKRLRFKLTQNDSRAVAFAEFTMPISEDSIAGYTALHGQTLVIDDAYAIPSERPYSFNNRFDKETGYRTRSMMSVPLKNVRNEVLGVMQLLNCKRRALHSTTCEIQPFSAASVHLTESLASQAAVAYENSQLYENQKKLFEGLVQAAATAIEQRDPTTSGHSTRVAELTLALAHAVNRTETGRYAGVHFTPEQLKELRYAALLHDFGKIAVREGVLVKAMRLYPVQLAIIRQRFEYVHQALDLQKTTEKLAVVQRNGDDRDSELARLDDEYARLHDELQEDLKFISYLNETRFVGDVDRLQLQELCQRRSYQDARGVKRQLLRPGEIAALSISRGSLTDDERREIESHVEHSFDFVMQIPWTPDLRYIPSIIRAHHEKLNGEGYPLGLREADIPVQSRIMMICDIFDALCAADRPYKKAVPVADALAILQKAANQNEIDEELLRIFIADGIYERATTRDEIGEISGVDEPVGLSTEA